mgnify:CR=1 FL=1
MRQIQEVEQPKESRRPIRFWNPGKFYDFTLLFIVIFLCLLYTSDAADE